VLEVVLILKLRYRLVITRSPALKRVLKLLMDTMEVLIALIHLLSATDLVRSTAPEDAWEEEPVWMVNVIATPDSVESIAL
jgi:hypothetical protein